MNTCKLHRITFYGPLCPSCQQELQAKQRSPQDDDTTSVLGTLAVEAAVDLFTSDTSTPDFSGGGGSFGGGGAGGDW